MTYQEQINHPKWQKKRLEILLRDGYQCVVCRTFDKPLHVHHIVYITGKLAWEHPDEFLDSLCEDCHKLQHPQGNSQGIPRYADIEAAKTFDALVEQIMSFQWD